MPAVFFPYLKDVLQDGLYNDSVLTPPAQGFEGILGAKSETTLPVVYFSLKNRRKPAWNPAAEKAAKKLFGLANLYKEPSREFSEFLREKTNGRNPFDGAVGIYWKQRFRILRNPSLRNIVYSVCRFWASSYIPEELTWDFIITLYYKKCLKAQTKKCVETAELLAVQEIQTEKSEARAKKNREDLRLCTEELELTQRELSRQKDEYEKFVEEFDPEIDRLKAENDRLKTELDGYKKRFSKSNAANFSIDFNLNEKNLFPGEIDDFVRGILFKGMLEKSKIDDRDRTRLKDVASDFVGLNPDFEFSKSQSAAKYERIDRQIKAGEVEIEDFYFESDNGHKKYSFCNDPRYRITKANTASDDRANKNLASDVRKFFLKP